MTIKKLTAFTMSFALLVLGAFGTVSAQTGAPRVAIQLASTGLTSPLVASSTNATVARLILDTTGSTEPVRIVSLPFILSTGNGATADMLMNCRVFNEANPTVALNTPAATSTPMSSGLNNIVLNAPLVLSANTVSTLALRCDVAGNLATNGTFTFSMNTANLVATGATTGLPAVVTVRGATVTPPPATPQTPGLPPTGAGGEAATFWTMLLGSLAAAGVGLGLMRKFGKKA